MWQKLKAKIIIPKKKECTSEVRNTKSPRSQQKKTRIDDRNSFHDISTHQKHHPVDIKTTIERGLH